MRQIDGRAEEDCDEWSDYFKSEIAVGLDNKDDDVRLAAMKVCM